MMSTLVVLALSGLMQADVDAAFARCHNMWDMCQTMRCERQDTTGGFLDCRKACRAEYDGCVEEIKSMIRQG
jgi:hypothetical protein